jgi:hypothetical protein
MFARVSVTTDISYLGRSSGDVATMPAVNSHLRL